MRTMFDVSPLFRSGVGFDRVFDLLENASRVQPIGNWPPYDIEKTGEDHYRIVIAVAGFSADELDITAEPNLLVVSGARQERNADVEVLHRGLVPSGFERRFHLADHVQVTGADLRDGLLVIDLVREVPEAMRPRKIPLDGDASAGSGGKARQIEHQGEEPTGGEASKKAA